MAEKRVLPIRARIKDGRDRLILKGKIRAEKIRKDVSDIMYNSEISAGMSEITDRKKITRRMKKVLGRDNIRKNMRKMLDKQEIKKQVDKYTKSAVIIIIILLVMGVALYLFERSFESPKDAADRIRELGALGPLVVIGIITIEVIVAPIPGYIIAIASGYAFGALQGALYSYIGNILGTMIAFFIARRFGRPLVEKITEKRKLKLYDSFFKDKGNSVLWITYLFPIFPSDIISFVVGLSNIKWKDLLIVVCVAYIPNLLFLNYFGSTLYEAGFGWNVIFFGIFFIILGFFGVIYYLGMRKKGREKKR